MTKIVFKTERAIAEKALADLEEAGLTRPRKRFKLDGALDSVFGAIARAIISFGIWFYERVLCCRPKTKAGLVLKECSTLLKESIELEKQIKPMRPGGDARLKEMMCKLHLQRAQRIRDRAVGIAGVSGSMRLSENLQKMVVAVKNMTVYLKNRFVAQEKILKKPDPDAKKRMQKPKLAKIDGKVLDRMDAFKPKNIGKPRPRRR
ncbi:MAG: hypothetical protein MRY21_07705 [Simkaniaceae bacterium]|nr:hypothetical protein [Simkaniaceae bacterium]